MKISGFTFVRNALRYDFPIVECISSALPLVDEFVVNVGESEDQTLEVVRSIPSPKIKIVEHRWDDEIRTDGRIFGIQQDLALAQCTGDWAVLLQADEVVHEEALPAIRRAMERYNGDHNVQGLVFRMLHFKGDYWSLDPWMYRKATRVVRNNGRIRSTTDYCDFVAEGSSRMIKNTPCGKLIKARIFHYGWVKDPTVLEQKLRFQISRHDGHTRSDQEIDRQALIRSQFPTYDILKEFRGTNPAVMQDRIQKARRLRPRINRWLNGRFYKMILKQGFKG